MTVKLLTEHHLEFLSLKGGRTGSSDSNHAIMPHCWKSRVTAYIVLLCRIVRAFLYGSSLFAKERIMESQV